MTSKQTQPKSKDTFLSDMLFYTGVTSLAIGLTSAGFYAYKRWKSRQDFDSDDDLEPVTFTNLTIETDVNSNEIDKIVGEELPDNMTNEMEELDDDKYRAFFQ